MAGSGKGPVTRSRSEACISGSCMRTATTRQGVSSAGWPQVIEIDAAAFRYDITDAIAVSRLVGDITARFGRLDILVNDAAYNVRPSGTRPAAAHAG